MAEESKGTVLLALGANAAVAVAKIVAGALGGSAVMRAEAAHSVADTLNQVFMYLSLRLSSRKPDRQHQFGYGTSIVRDFGLTGRYWGRFERWGGSWGS
jgi:divalent metal cation (Fe/Co/Zn/Cd) transporter